jgi:hypothetical protein
MKRRFGDNPFYVLLVACGVAFTLTAAAYFVMTLRGQQPAAESEAADGLTGFLRRHGVWLLAAELAALAVCCAAAIFTDDYWSRRAAQRRESLSGNSSPDTRHQSPDTSSPSPDTSS